MLSEATSFLKKSNKGLDNKVGQTDFFGTVVKCFQCLCTIESNKSKEQQHNCIFCSLSVFIIIESDFLSNTKLTTVSCDISSVAASSSISSSATSSSSLELTVLQFLLAHYHLHSVAD